MGGCPVAVTDSLVLRARKLALPCFTHSDPTAPDVRLNKTRWFLPLPDSLRGTYFDDAPGHTRALA